jgi:hypothetical protein
VARGGSGSPRSGGDGEHTLRLILKGWRLLRADWRREYRTELWDDIETLSWDDFCAFLSGLSRDSVWRHWAAEQPRIVTDLDEIASITAAMRA